MVCSVVTRDPDRQTAGYITHFYQKDKRLRALMIEVRRDLYMDEQSAEKLPGFDEVRNIIRHQLIELVKFRE
jgi:N-formylglutamate amidohydrolase